MRAFAFIFFAVGAPDAWALLDARAVRRSNRRLSAANFAQLKVTASDGAWADEFGYSVAIDGDTVVVGAAGKDGMTGAAYIFRTTDGGATYDEVAKLTASDAAAGDHFGRAVAIDGGIVVVGARSKEAAYVFRTTDGVTYDEVAKLTASDAAAGDWFGHSVAIDGATIVIGTESGGAAYAFRTTDGGATYVEVAKLTASDGVSSDGFGYSVAIDGDTIVVGAHWDDDGSENSGSVYVFRTTSGSDTYDQVAKLTAADPAMFDIFGRSVAIDGDTIVAGAMGDDDGSFGSGSAYVFRTTDGGATYGQVAKLTAADAAMSDSFGGSVAINGTTIVVGANFDDDSGSASGSAYVFRTSDGGDSYGQVAKLTASDGAAEDWFGASVAIDGNSVVIGAFDNNGDGSGAAYVFSPPAPTVQPTPRPTLPKPTPQPSTPQPTPQPTTPEPSVAALGSDSATRAGGTLATALLAFAATALAL